VAPILAAEEPDARALVARILQRAGHDVTDQDDRRAVEVGP
jgi:hypothetical protein